METKTAFGLTQDETLNQIRANSPAIVPNQFWLVKNKDGEILRRIRILAKHPDGGWIYVDTPSKLRKRDLNIMGICPEYNLRRVFELEA